MSKSRSKSANAKPLERFVVGITGASGAIYGCRLIETLLLDRAHEVHFIVTPAGLRVLSDEMKKPKRLAKVEPGGTQSSACDYLNLSKEQAGRLVAHSFKDIGAGPASGTFQTNGMIVAPCSMNTLGAIAHGISNNLLTRAAAVTLKEGRPLVLVPRETPFTLIDLRNMVALAEAGAIILPANPGFYHRPGTVEDVVRYVTQKILDRLGVEVTGGIRWGEGEKDKVKRKKEKGKKY